MKCDLCGSKKDVRKFYGVIKQKYYKECRECFEKVMAKTLYPKEVWEREWVRGAIV